MDKVITIQSIVDVSSLVNALNNIEFWLIIIALTDMGKLITKIFK